MAKLILSYWLKWFERKKILNLDVFVVLQLGIQAFLEPIIRSVAEFSDTDIFGQGRRRNVQEDFFRYSRCFDPVTHRTVPEETEILNNERDNETNYSSLLVMGAWPTRNMKAPRPG
jgi:hypothetical protein